MRNATIYVEADRGHAMRRTKGFSLIELLIVVAIILVIVAVALVIWFAVGG